MTKERLTAFSDGVLAIIITITVLEFQPPHGGSFAALCPMLPSFLSYVLSFLYIAIYWNNHHHLLYAVERVGGGVLWANMHLLFWLSLIPFATKWTGEHSSAPAPTAVYGGLLLLASLAYWALQSTILGIQDCDSLLRTALGRDLKGKLSPLIYALGIGLAFVSPWLADAIYTLVALLWLVPDRRIENAAASRTDRKETALAAGTPRKI